MESRKRIDGCERRAQDRPVIVDEGGLAEKCPIVAEEYIR
jgi:hypothetical protein